MLKYSKIQVKEEIKYMKKLLILLLVISIASFALFSCVKGGNGENGGNGGNNNGDSSSEGGVDLDDNGPPDASLVDPDGWTKPD